MKSIVCSALFIGSLIICGCSGDDTEETIVHSLVKVGGDNQGGNAYQYLPIPLTIRVEDEAGTAIPNRNVTFEIAQGNGNISVEEATTNQNGQAQVVWTLGDPNLEQELRAYSKLSNGNNISNSPQIFTAYFDEVCLASTLQVDVVMGATWVESVITGGSPPYSLLWSSGQTTSTIQPSGSGEYHLVVTDFAGCSDRVDFEFLPGCAGVTEITDADGNTYPITDIGSQCWTVKNLRTTKYTNGDPIEHIPDAQAWAATTTGAYSFYDNNSGNEAIYGKLYNWPAVMDERKVCPEGWHVPTDADWSELGLALGGPLVAGGKLKSTGTEYWHHPNSSATNESGFTALPASFRDSVGTYYDIGKYGIWWTSTSLTSEAAWLRMVYFNATNLNRFGNNTKNGLAVRCVKD